MKKVYMILYVILILLLSSFVSAEVIMFQWNPDNGTDTHIREVEADTNYGTAHEYLLLGDDAGDMRGLIQPLNSTFSIPNGSTINWVKLQIDVYGLSAGTTLIIYPMNKSWDRATVTWNSINDGCKEGQCYNSTFAIGSLAVTAETQFNITMNTTWYQKLEDEGGAWDFSKGVFLIEEEGDFFRIRNSRYYGTDPAKVITWFVDFTPPGAVAGSPATPTFVYPTPYDNAVNNTNQTINVTHEGTDIRYYLNVSLVGGNANMSYIFNETETETGHKTFGTNFSDGVYSYAFFVQNITNGLFSLSTTRILTIDTSAPTRWDV